MKYFLKAEYPAKVRDRELFPGQSARKSQVDCCKAILVGTKKVGAWAEDRGLQNSRVQGTTGRLHNAFGFARSNFRIW